jgi:hypothetical protein
LQALFLWCPLQGSEVEEHEPVPTFSPGVFSQKQRWSLLQRLAFSLPQSAAPERWPIEVPIRAAAAARSTASPARDRNRGERDLGRLLDIPSPRIARVICHPTNL